MWVDDGPAVGPKRGRGQVIEQLDAVSVPLPAVHVPVSPARASQAGCRGDSGHDEAIRTLISGDALACCSTLAAVCLCQVWFCFLATGQAVLFYYQATSSARQFAALLADTLLLTGLFVGLGWVGNWMGRFRAGEWLRNMAFLSFLVVPANALRCLYHPSVSGKLNLEYWRRAAVGGFSPILSALGMAAVVALLVLPCVFHRRLVRIVFRTLVLLFPVVPFMLAEASWFVMTRPAPVTPDGGNFVHAGPTAGVRPQRVVWIIFDEMDYRLAFETAANAHLQEFNRLADQSLYATQAYPPGGRTMVSVPALLSGRLVTSSQAVGPAGLLLHYDGAPGSVLWQTGQTIFSLEQEKGWRTGVVGWYFPYSRVFGRDTEASQFQGRRVSLNPDRPFLGLMADDLRVLAEGKSQSVLGRSLSLNEHEQLVTKSVAAAIRQAANPSLDLVFLHLPVTHAPFFYDAGTGQDAARLRPVMGYLDHLQLADHVLGQLRQAMQQAGLADQTALLVSSDHWNREGDLLDGKMDHRVPFIVSFPGRSAGVRYSAPFNTILSRRLVTAIMRGQVHNAVDAAAWLDREKGTLTESPYNRN
jgi:hypothetical protein